MFSRATIMEIMSLLSIIKTHSQLDSYFYKYGVENYSQGSSKEQKTFNMGKYLLENPDEKGILSDDLQFEIIEDVIGTVIDRSSEYDERTGEFKNFPQLKIDSIFEDEILEAIPAIKTIVGVAKTGLLIKERYFARRDKGTGNLSQLKRDKVKKAKGDDSFCLSHSKPVPIRCSL